MKKEIFGVTLIELMIAIALTGVVVLAFSSIDFFSRAHVLNAERRAKLQNELSYTLEHMGKNIIRGTGDVADKPLASWGNGFRLRVDNNNPPTPANYSDDTWVGYMRFGPDTYQIRYYTNLSSPFAVPDSGTAYEEILAKHIPNYDAVAPTSFTLSENDTVIDILLYARYRPGVNVSPDNPQIQLRSRYYCRSASSY